ncbi:putative outer membrane starch-binding protein [Mucilaginibacter gracilis]|uniref:Putative outer membrane starch-binding protein n=1 Tax=Mucilaginibacter gracilis TaxID=423350 RepID=A0A495J864_9SPHI|nr:RagB/SusD family nutrient uptake outer membrane protein [Mucilaginibacter gracilis]RKR84564.1 putative outer membrane starch-binding protein [Mucilaginibacter gracilis]
MKKYLKMVSVFSLITITTACQKFVDYNPHDSYQVTALDYLQTESDYRTMEVSAYTPLQWINQVVPIGDIASDNAVTGGESASDVLDLQQIDDYTTNPVNGTLAGIWQYAYEGINRANYLTQYKATNPAGTAVNFAGKDAMYGEVYFLRAYYYFTLVKMFGDVPLFIDKRLDPSSSGKLTRAAKSAVYAQIEADLNNAISVLPTVQLQQGRITKYAAQALLGKIYLYEKKYDQAATMLQNVINANAFVLVSDFASIFLATGENGPESVFEIQYTNTSPYYQWSNVLQGQGNYAVQQCGVRNINGNSPMPYAAGWSTNLPTQNLAAAYSAGDQRKAVTVLDIEAYKAANPSYNISYQLAPYKNTGLYNQKYLPRKGETSGQQELNYLNNFRTIRYADVLLMAAEAYNKSSSPNDTKAQQYLNQVRRRAFQVSDASHDVTSTGTTLYAAILIERRLELAMEGERFFDLVRTGQAATVLAGTFKAGKNEVFPIPQQEIAISGLTQNPGY